MRRNQEAITEVDVDVKPPATPAQLARVLEKAREQRKAENKIARLEKELKTAKSELKLIQTKELPELMNKASLDECPLGGGWEVVIENVVTASIPSPDSERAENAAERNKIGVAVMRKVAPDLLQNQIIIDFPIKEEKFYKKFMRDLQQRKRELNYVVRTTIHSGTLGAWVRAQDRLGKAVNEEALNVHRFKRTVINAPKAKKGAKEKV